jgi:hypothetical protein
MGRLAEQGAGVGQSVWGCAIAFSEELDICAEAVRLDMTDWVACRASSVETDDLRRVSVKRVLVVAVAMVCLSVGDRIGSAQNSGGGQQAVPAQNAAPAKDAGPAKEAAPAKDATATAITGIVGKWHFVIETPGGDREADADLAVDQDGKVTGRFGTSDVAGTYKEGQLDLNFSFTSDEVGETAPLKVNGKLDDTSALTGTWEFISYSGTFKATRPKA